MTFRFYPMSYVFVSFDHEVLLPIWRFHVYSSSSPSVISALPSFYQDDFGVCFRATSGSSFQFSGVFAFTSSSPSFSGFKPSVRVVEDCPKREPNPIKWKRFLDENDDGNGVGEDGVEILRKVGSFWIPPPEDPSPKFYKR